MVLAKKTIASTGPTEYNKNNLKNNNRKKILIIGSVGAGKSTLCNVMSGEEPSSNKFPVSPEPDSRTAHTHLSNVFFNKDCGKPVSIIDTEGFNAQSERFSDAKIISNIVVTLQKKCDFVNLFVIVINGAQVRFDGSIIGMMRVFESMFGEEFWKRAVIVFTYVSMDKVSRQKRLRHYGRHDEELAELYMERIRKEFTNIEHNLEFFFIDALRLQSDHDEEQHFQKSMLDLWITLEASPPLSTDTFEISFGWTKNEELIKSCIKKHQEELEKEKQKMLVVIFPFVSESKSSPQIVVLKRPFLFQQYPKTTPPPHI